MSLISRLLNLKPLIPRDYPRWEMAMVGETRGQEITGSDDQIMPVRDQGDVVTAIILLGNLASKLGFTSVAKASIMTAASELAGNILKYAERGVLKIRTLEGRRGKGIEVIAEDHGPGIDDLQMAMRDHFSESGTLGLGLPGAKRLMDEFHLWSEVGKGTKVTIRKWRA